MTPRAPAAGTLLFSVDLEEFYPAIAGAVFRCTPLPDLARRYLDLLSAAGARATFFVVGELARKHPEVVATIAAAGHEIGSHGDKHLPVDRLSERGFALDLRASRAALMEAGVGTVRGFRAPIFSMTARTPWAHRVLADEGFAYSSSVLPAANPLYGWPEFGIAARSIDGVIELPITTGNFLHVRLPIFGGTYFRISPEWWLRRRCRHALAEGPVQSYFHPYDIDTNQERVLHAGLKDRPALNRLLFYNRSALPNRIRWLLNLAGRTPTYSHFLEEGRFL